MLRATELQYEQTIIEAAKATGWLVHAERAAVSRGKWATPIKGHAGFPDLVLVHSRYQALVVLELKRKPNKPTDDQRRWLAALQQCEGVISHLIYVPDQLDWVLRALAEPFRFFDEVPT